MLLPAIALESRETRRISQIEFVHFKVDVRRKKSVRSEEVAEFVAKVGAYRTVAGISVDEDPNQPALTQ